MVLMKRTQNKTVPVETKKHQDIFKALWIFNLINKIFMVAPYSIRGAPNNRSYSTVHNLDIIYYLRCLAIISLSCYGLTFYINIASRLKIIQAFLNTISITIIIPLIFINRNNYVKMLRKFEELEMILNERGIVYKFEKLQRISWLQLIVIFFISVISQSLVSPEFSVLRKCLLFILFVLPNIVTLLYLCQYINLVLIIHDWLEGLNDYLKELLITEFEAVKRLDNSRKFFHFLWELSKDVEKVYQLPVLVLMGTTFINTAAFVYLWIVVAKINPSTYLWFFSNALKIFLLPLMCELCRTKDLDIRVTLQKIISLKFGDLRDEEGLNTLDFSMLLAHEKITFYCCGMFPLDLSWVFSMGAAVSIYVVIFLQNNVND